MPELDGYTFLQEMKKDPRYRGIPVIMVSVCEEMDTVMNCLKSGADDYILKPVTSQVLLKHVKRIFHARQTLTSSRTEIKERPKRHSRPSMSTSGETLQDHILIHLAGLVDLLQRSVFLAPTDAHREALQRSIEAIQSAGEDAVMALPTSSHHPSPVPSVPPNLPSLAGPTPAAATPAPVSSQFLGIRLRERVFPPAPLEVSPPRSGPIQVTGTDISVEPPLDDPAAEGEGNGEEASTEAESTNPYPSRSIATEDTGPTHQPAATLSPAPSLGSEMPLTPPSFIPPQEVETLFDWDFDSLEHSHEELQTFLFQMFCELGLIDEFKIPVPSLRKFLQKVDSLYFENPYHNFYHAFDVTQMLMVFISCTQLAALLSPLDKLALLLSGICHDLEHPGTNNNFQNNALTPLAYFYNDHSALENHHCAKAFALMTGDTELNILRGLTKPQYRDMRKKIISCILATDMTHHFGFVQRLKARLETKIDVDIHSQTDLQLLLETLMKAADICNPIRAFPIAYKWAERVNAEFKAQVQREEAEGLPKSMELTTLPQSQINFIVFVTEPLFSLISQVIPEFRRASTVMHQNLRLWRRCQEGTSSAQELAAMSTNDFIRDCLTPRSQRKQLPILKVVPDVAAAAPKTLRILPPFNPAAASKPGTPGSAGSGGTPTSVSRHSPSSLPFSTPGPVPPLVSLLPPPPLLGVSPSTAAHLGTTGNNGRLDFVPTHVARTARRGGRPFRRGNFACRQLNALSTALGSPNNSFGVSCGASELGFHFRPCIGLPPFPLSLLAFFSYLLLPRSFSIWPEPA
ncbi:putative cyclic-nucleotide phosphodiesterase regA [Paratrimastix pyriformis]|uniref:Phosphodiesterase n=1 Tax=Paratrimastix pyriformis TaxID=342808 RepID=A0ABQ8UUM3_9EUKA|nr:putative cyclic-nucleotide phosphodiesterase regA [Paratrimastix pyriformis]